MIPGRGLFALLAVLLVCAIPAVISPSLLTVWVAAALALLTLAWFDLRAALRREPPRVVRALPVSLPLGIWQEVTLEIRSHDRSRFNVELFDDHPANDAVEGLPVRLAVPAGANVAVCYRYRPLVRGDRPFGLCHVLIDSPWRIWRQRVRLGGTNTARVYPNFAAIAKYALLATDNRLSQIGIRKRPQRGEGFEFHQLREYRSGDGFRQIDWKASSRMRKLISREYQIERDQQIMLLVDSGRRMLTRDGEFTHFDHSLNAALLLAHVALRQGDLVGIRTFGGKERQFAPRKGSGTLRQILETFYDLQATAQSPDYMQVAEAAAIQLKKRSLIVFVTNLRDEDLAEIVPAVRLLQRRHLVLLASLRETALDAALLADINDFDDALKTGAVHEYLRGRRRTHEIIRSHGVATLDVEAQELATRVVNRYLDIKRSGVL